MWRYGLFFSLHKCLFRSRPRTAFFMMGVGLFCCEKRATAGGRWALRRVWQSVVAGERDWCMMIGQGAKMEDVELFIH